MKFGRYAAIDIGTVTCRLLVADVDKKGIHELEKGYGITNLGEGVDATGLLKPEAMQRVVDQIRSFQQTIDSYRDAEHPTIEVIAMATSASRDAKNSADFLERLDEIGVSLTIIPGEKEAALSFTGVSNDFPSEDILVIDVGGGSTEFSAGYAGESPVLRHSFNVGCRRVTERFLPSDPPSENELSMARAWIKETMEPFFVRLASSDFTIGRMVAVAGTATTVVSVHKKMKVYNSGKVHRSIVSAEVLEKVYEDLRKVNLDQRKETIGLDPGRAGVIVAGLLILEVAMELAGQESFTVSEADILQGIILDTATK